VNRAVFVAAGILISRVAGFIRARVFAYYFGLSDSADAFNAAYRIPNFLQNLFGEGALSASFIPVYASLVSRGKREEADRVAGAVFALVAVITSVLVLLGVLATPFLIAVIAPGFTGEKRELAISLTRILFPGTGMLVLSAWCLGILNSHHRFTLSYAAPVMVNAAMISTMVYFGGGSSLSQLAEYLAWGAVVGSALQFGVQLPVVLSVAPNLRISFDTASEHVRTIARNFVPAFISRGVVQLSAYIDSLLASLLPTGAVTGLTNASLLYTLPVSLFGVAVAASELPAMAGAAGTAALDAASAEAVRLRLDAGLRRIAFFVVPSSVAFLALGDVVAGAVLQTGRFTAGDADYVWAILAGSSIGLVAQTLGRLYSSTCYALRDTRTPLRFALVRVVITTVLGYVFAIPLPHVLGIGTRWGAAGLTLSAGLAGWVEMFLLRRALRGRIGSTGMPATYLMSLWAAALTGAAVGWGVKLTLPPVHPVVQGAAVLLPYGATYFGVALALRVPEAKATIRRALRRG
jgi:putative peptidoglycan lipid II flippase